MWRFLFVLAVLLLPQPVWAQAAVPATCESDFHMALRDRAWMEGQREIEVSEVLIKQAESVLDYTCFKNAAERAGQSSLFGKDLAGSVKKVLAGGAFNCISMEAAWDAVRCSNLDQDTVFPELGEIAFKDFRGCSSPRSEANWKSAYEQSNASRAASPTWGQKNLPDRVQIFAQKRDSSDCGSSAIVKTGLLLEDGSEAGTCLARGCYYDGSACVADVAADAADVNGEAATGG